MHPRLLPVFLFATCALPAAAAAPIYKWVDAGGITYYGDRAPAGVRAVTLAPEASRVSVYGTDPLLRAALAAEHERAVTDLRTGRRQRELEREWFARQYFAALAAAARPAPQPPCGTVFAVPSVGTPAPLAVPQIALVPGTTAGHVNSGGAIPGTSGSVVPAPSPPRAVPERGAVVRLH